VSTAVLLRIGIEPDTAGGQCGVEVGVAVAGEHPPAVDRGRVAGHPGDRAGGITTGHSVVVDQSEPEARLPSRVRLAGEVVVHTARPQHIRREQQDHVPDSRHRYLTLSRRFPAHLGVSTSSQPSASNPATAITIRNELIAAVECT